MVSTNKYFVCTCMNPSLASKVPETLSLKGDSLLRGDVFLRQISLGSGCLLGDGSENQSWGPHYLQKSQANILLSIWMTLIFFNIFHFSINYPRISECGQSRPREGSALKLSPLGLKGFSEETQRFGWFWNSLFLKLSFSGHVCQGVYAHTCVIMHMYTEVNSRQTQT